MKNFTLDGRLSSAAKFVRQGARFADIGTDHAHLPIFLLKSGTIDYAVCSDINEGPLASARENALLAGVIERVDFTLANGADALKEKDVTDIAVCGMGGELIAEIITRADFLKREGIRLILQPMSRHSVLREALAGLGYSVIAEEYSSSSGKLYVTLCAEYTGKSYEISEFEAEFGKKDFLNNLVGVKRDFLKRKADALMRAARGKAEGGEKISKEQRLFNYINDILSKGDN